MLLSPHHSVTIFGICNTKFSILYQIVVCWSKDWFINTSITQGNPAFIVAFAVNSTLSFQKLIYTITKTFVNARRLFLKMFKYKRQVNLTYSTSDNETPPISLVLIGRYLILCWLTSPPCCNSPRKYTPVKYKKRQKAGFPIVT